MSRGSEKLYNILREAYSDTVTIQKEWAVGKNLRLDFYIPSLMLGFEFHGEQHEQFISHFHKDAAGFQSSLLRDTSKIDLCTELGIALVTFWHDEEITVDEVYRRSLEALSERKPPPLQEDSLGDKRRAYARDQYKKAKAKRKK